MAQPASTDPERFGRPPAVTLEPPAASSVMPASAAGALACLQLLEGLRLRGLRRVVLCPGSRSAPLAVAASLLESNAGAPGPKGQDPQGQDPEGLTLHTAIDERSAAFFALGLARASDRPVAVVTTSGSAVANLLPALVEADQGTIPLLLLTADRPQRLKGCGANQTVNQEAFLRPCCRWVGQGAPDGLASMAPEALEQLAARALAAAVGAGPHPAGPVHLNLPLEEPLHPDGDALAWLRRWPRPPRARDNRLLPIRAWGNRVLDNEETEKRWHELGNGALERETRERANREAATTSTEPGEPPPLPLSWGEAALDPDQPGVVVAGPWRGRARDWAGHLRALERWQERSGWPVLADALSGLRGALAGPTVTAYDLLLEPPPQTGPAALSAPQVLRLGPLPASRRLQRWLERQTGPQVLVSEGDPRPLDPLRRIRGQWSGGLATWPGLDLAPPGTPTAAARALSERWLRQERRLQERLGEAGENGDGPIEEPWLARRLGQGLPPGLAVMLANSSPVRDWDTFADPAAPGRPVYSFRGASGIDGTLSIACGLAEAVGELVLVCGDLALLHDSNGWLWSARLRGRLLVVLIDNDGGGIFEQLPIRPLDGDALDFERLFAMPQRVDPCALAGAHGVPSRQVRRKGEVAEALAWGLAQPLALLRVVSDRVADAARRRQLRTMAAALNARP